MSILDALKKYNKKYFEKYNGMAELVLFEDGSGHINYYEDEYIEEFDNLEQFYEICNRD